MLGRIERLRTGLGDDQRDRLADIADLASRQYRLRRKGKRLPGLHIGFRRRAQRLQPVGPRIFGSQQREHPRRRPRRLAVDALDPRMRMRRAQHDRLHQTLEGEIVEIAPTAGDEPQILAALRCIANDRARRCHLGPDRHHERGS